jgi:hypothetical protein
MRNFILTTLLLFILTFQHLLAKDVPILKYEVDSYGCVQIEVNSSSNFYYVLHCKPKPDEALEFTVSITPGKEGTTTLSEGLRAYSVEHYRVSEHLIDSPDDVDNDGINDMEELAELGRLAPLNPAAAISPEDGMVCIPDKETFTKLSYKGEEVSIDYHLENLEYVKFHILKEENKNPQVYFMNTVTHRIHRRFAKKIGVDYEAPVAIRGEIIYHPMILSPNGRLGVYRFEFEPNDSYPFEAVQKYSELLVSNMPFLQNNWIYFPMPNKAIRKYNAQKSLYNNSRISVFLYSDIYKKIDYMPLNQKEGYGVLKKMNLGERPNARDIVLYETLPNEMSRVGGIITSVAQTPLSHVNLRAIQDNVPNAYIAGAHITQNITDLMGKYVYYKVEKETYQIRQATLAEVERHYEKLRPENTQYPKCNLSITKIRPLKKIKFDDSDGFGVKAANVAAMRKFGFPEGTIPDGFAIPFYFYDEFMKYNNFYSDVEEMLNNPDFQSNYEVQETMLSDFRLKIKNAEMPKWMMKALSKMQNSFSSDTPIRCRSSTNNEDLPGFSGAGLYSSKTQKPDEGHISKSIKQVYASLWNFRAFDERQFYRIDHFSVAMGVLCHSNYTNEQANGVAVSTDPLYHTQNTYYLNTQIGEDLVTNPESLSIPEEILLDTNSEENITYKVLHRSNLITDDKTIMSDEQLNELQKYLTIIQNNFKTLYKATKQSNFAMEVEYKISSDNKLIIKQARPWLTDPCEQLNTKEN